MSQSKRWSAYESIINIVVGIGISFTVSLISIRLLGYPISVSDNLVITAVMTVVSFVRSFYLRRLFNWMYVKGYGIQDKK